MIGEANTSANGSSQWKIHSPDTRTSSNEDLEKAKYKATQFYEFCKSAGLSEVIEQNSFSTPQQQTATPVLNLTRPSALYASLDKVLLSDTIRIFKRWESINKSYRDLSDVFTNLSKQFQQISFDFNKSSLNIALRNLNSISGLGRALFADSIKMDKEISQGIQEKIRKISKKIRL